MSIDNMGSESLVSLDWGSRWFSSKEQERRNARVWCCFLPPRTHLEVHSSNIQATLSHKLFPVCKTTFLETPVFKSPRRTLSYFTQTGQAYDENTEAKFQLRLWAKIIKHFGNFRRHCFAIHLQHVRTCTAHDGAVCSKIEKELSHAYHRDRHNTRHGARLLSSSTIMAPSSWKVLF